VVSAADPLRSLISVFKASREKFSQDKRGQSIRVNSVHVPILRILRFIVYMMNAASGL
jgi:hypothetical protein